MSKNRKRRKSRALQKFIVILLVLVIVVLLGFFCIYRPLKQRLVSTVTQELISSQVSSGELSDDDVEAILNSMSSEDRDALEQIINSHLSAGTIADLMPYLAKGDLAGLKDYAQNALTQEELAKLQEIYRKYQDEINAYLK